MPACRYMKENGLAAMLAIKRSAGVAPKVNLRECIIPMPPSSVNKAAHSGFETQMKHHQKSKTGVSMAPQKGLVLQKFLKKIMLDQMAVFSVSLVQIGYLGCLN